MDKLKILNIAILLVGIITAFIVQLYWSNYCGGHQCSQLLIDGLLRPLYWMSVTLAIISGSLLVYRSTLFKHWLCYVASWAVPVWIYLILDQDPRQHGFLAIGRSEVVWLVGIALFIVTAVYVIGWHLFFWKKGSVKSRELLKLLLLAIPAVLFKVGWDLF